ncbi:sigma-70 family RNA polymerase sigma factor [Rubinisphaera sp.]|uniref:sigma-70 family RNA polymerase sigma factor n=1 Tax=Rubinisphaera sp. TaxID=2024857 RepID=UPI000C0F8003|nr:sigma-70 family RNA polymerase sigma factor [Rubinisphaera sp.]MBV10548.1 RNA polymerase subunit sigma-24 [Rubinisphaera sp.]
MNEVSQPTWLPALRNHDKRALSQCFDEYRSRLRQIVNFRLNPRLSTRMDTDDVLQEAYLAAAQRIEHCDSTSAQSVFIWLRLIVQQTIVDLHRKHLKAAGRDVQREVRADRTDPGTSGCIASHLIAQVSSPSMSMKRDEMNTRLMQALNQMEATDREVLALRHFEELTNNEVAETLQISVKAASIRYIRALKKLKTAMDSLTEFKMDW